MIIEVTPAKQLPSDEKYPYIGKSTFDGLIVLFSAPDTGTVLSSRPFSHNVGFYSDSWGEHFFEKFDGTITITC